MLHLSAENSRDNTSTPDQAKSGGVFTPTPPGDLFRSKGEIFICDKFVAIANSPYICQNN
ncbi:hypothetical protein SAMN05444412_1198 [Rhodonellum ikkaensis]|uniref:Uncharacterized protein n=1 Tax=Rhodonellum ikkaensis TaxID=336829 RepID=A0A1H3TLF4_9BACT|nr:hypothetical protein SAMN05444412_1198 [Rhodonellum ikkaensis]